MKWIEMSVDEAYNIGLQDGHNKIWEDSFADTEELKIAYKSGYKHGNFWYDRLVDFYGF